MGTNRWIPSLAVLLVTGCAGDGPSGAVAAPRTPSANVGVAGAAIDVDGTWDHVETVHLTFTGEAAAAFGVVAEGPVLHVTCDVVGTMTLDQDGATFTGTLAFDDARTTCRTAGGQTGSAPWTVPYSAALSGRVTGHAIHITQIEPEGIVCTKHGSATVAGGVATRLDIRGGCDLSAFPFRPATARNLSTATRP